MDNTEQKDRVADDLLIGAPAIAEFLGVPEKTVYYWVAKDRIPAGKIGKNLIASKRQLRKVIATLTA